MLLLQGIGGIIPVDGGNKYGVTVMTGWISEEAARAGCGESKVAGRASARFMRVYDDLRGTKSESVQNRFI